MPGVAIVADEIRPHVTSRWNATKATALIASMLARAAGYAPRVTATDLDDTQVAAVKGILIDVIARRYDVLPGVTRASGAGSVSKSDDAKSLPSLFWDSEIAELRDHTKPAGTPAAEDTGIPRGCFPAPEPLSW